MKRIFITLILSLLATSCDSIISSNHYEVISAEYGRVYLINKSSGELYVVEGKIKSKVIENSIQSIAKGAVFYTEENKYIEYIGNGKFREKPLSEFSDQELMNELEK